MPQSHNTTAPNKQPAINPAMSDAPKFRSDARIKWYRCKVDPTLMSELLQKNDVQGFRQSLAHLGLFFTTGMLAYFTFRWIDGSNWMWSLPLLLLALFIHGTFSSFFVGIAGHELTHRTPFKTKAWNDFFLKIFSFFGWSDRVWYRPSHIKHHQLTVYHHYDGEVVLPLRFSFKDWNFWLNLFAWSPLNTWNTLKLYYKRATGRMDNEWYEFLMPQSNRKLRHEHRDWARFTLIGHAALATVFIATGHWFLIVVFTFGNHYCKWLCFLCGSPQHFGLSPNTPDFRLCCRTFTCSWLPAFLYWNMQYHIEHHMFPAVPFFNLPKLRGAIAHDLPPAPHGLLATWKEMLAIHRKQIADPDYVFVPQLPQSKGDQVSDEVLEREAAALALD